MGGLTGAFSAAEAVIKFINSAKNLLNTFSNAVRVSEPASPSGLTLQNTDAPATKLPSPFPEIKMATLAASKFEEIYDPSHPFSPRWDFLGTERDLYSPLTTGYMENSKNAVFCAGVKEAKDEQDAKKKKDLEVKVDVLEFRRKQFEDHLLPRIGFNLACYMDKGEDEVTMTMGSSYSYYGVPTVDFLKLLATSYCYKITQQATITISPYYPGTAGKAKRMKCWDCFKMAQGKVKNDDTPPCSTQYTADDKKMLAALPPPVIPWTPAYIMTRVYPGLLNNFNYKYPSCDIPGHNNNKPTSADLCKDLRRPVAMINKLKMRYHNPDEPDNIVLTEGVPEGLTFKEYFDDHMPYPRLWDTGTSIQKNQPDDVKFQEPMDTSGQYTAIVGVGREATPKSVTDPDKIRKDERCLAGGWGGDVSFGGISIKKSDPITSWTELKLYQSRTYRDWGLACIGRYEKTFKPGSTENVILAQTGAEWSSIVITKCPTKADGTLDAANCQYLSYKQYKDAGGANAGGGANSTNTISRYKQASYPLGWRGYISAKKEDIRFPKFGGSPALKTGLDDVDLGDIILFPKGSGKAGDKPGLPKIAKVSKIYRCEDNKNCYIEVAEVDNGKYPDACGTTDNWGEVKVRTIYKPGKMLPNIAADLARINSTNNCEDTKLAHCELTDWNSTQYYRISEDVRPGCDKINASECK